MVVQDVVVRLGSHLACFYTTDAGRLRLGLPFLRDGLLAGQSVLLLRTTPDVREHYFAALRTERALERAEVAVVLVDASEPLTEQEADLRFAQEDACARAHVAHVGAHVDRQREHDEQRDEARVDDRERAEAEHGARALEALLPEQQERPADELGPGLEQLFVGRARGRQAEPGMHRILVY